MVTLKDLLAIIDFGVDCSECDTGLINGKNWPFTYLKCEKPWLSFTIKPISLELYSFLLKALHHYRDGLITSLNIKYICPFFIAVTDGTTWLNLIESLCEARGTSIISLINMSVYVSQYMLTAKYICMDQINMAFLDPNIYARVVYIEKTWSSVRLGLVTIDVVLATNAPKQGAIVQLIDSLYESGEDVSYHTIKDVWCAYPFKDYDVVARIIL